MHHLHRDRDLKLELYEDNIYYKPQGGNNIVNTNNNLTLLSHNLNNYPHQQQIQTNNTTSISFPPTISNAMNQDANGNNSPMNRVRDNENNGSSPMNKIRDNNLGQRNSWSVPMSDGCYSPMDVDNKRREGGDRRALSIEDCSEDNMSGDDPSPRFPRLEILRDIMGPQQKVGGPARSPQAPKRMTKRLRLESLQAYMTPEQKEEQKRKLRGNGDEFHEKVKGIKCNIFLQEYPPAKSLSLVVNLTV